MKYKAASIGDLQEYEPKGITTQAFISCIFCEMSLASIGGPKRVLCERCYKAITGFSNKESLALKTCWTAIMLMGSKDE